MEVGNGNGAESTKVPARSCWGGGDGCGGRVRSEGPIRRRKRKSRFIKPADTHQHRRRHPELRGLGASGGTERTRCSAMEEQLGTTMYYHLYCWPRPLEFATSGHYTARATRYRNSKPGERVVQIFCCRSRVRDGRSLAGHPVGRVSRQRPRWTGNRGLRVAIRTRGPETDRASYSGGGL